MIYYTGIGSRSTPEDILKDMTNIATNLELSGFKLRSGGANGADSAFEAGVSDPRNADIYLPWKGFNNNPSALHNVRQDARDMAKKFHPAWERCSQAARLFHARNCYQILGLYLDQPTDFVLCWTPNGAETGGTGQALRIAHHYKIPVFNMANNNWDTRFNTLVKNILAEPAY
jgi:hypothetical protein